MGHEHTHSHHGEPDWDDEADWYNEMADGLEPELSKATAALLEAARISAGSMVLDLACGPGHTTAAATALGAKATGLDSSAAMIRHATRRFPTSTFQLGDMLAPPPGPWDAILCRLGGHHVDSVWLSKAVEVLQPGGRLAIAETGANEQAPAMNMKSPEEWVVLLEQAGLQDVEWTDSGANMDKIPESVWKTDLADHEHQTPEGPIYVICGRKPSGPPEI